MKWFIGVRKWSIMLIILGMASVFLGVGWLNGAEWVDLTKGSAIAFFSANIGEHIINWIRAK